MKLKNTKLFLCGILAALFLARNIQDSQFVMSFFFAVVAWQCLRAAFEAGMHIVTNAPTPAAPSMVKAIDIYLQKLEKGEEIAPVVPVVDNEKEEFIRNQQHKLAKKSRTRRTTTAAAK